MRNIFIYLVLNLLLQSCSCQSNGINLNERVLYDLLSLDTTNYFICAKIQSESKKLFFIKELSDKLKDQIKNFCRSNKFQYDPNTLNTTQGGNTCILVETVLNSLIESVNYSNYSDSLRIEVLLNNLGKNESDTSLEIQENLLAKSFYYASKAQRFDIYNRFKSDTVNGLFVIKNIIRSNSNNNERSELIHFILNQLRPNPNSLYNRILRSLLDYCSDDIDNINQRCSEGLNILNEELIKLKELDADNSEANKNSLKIEIGKIEDLVGYYNNMRNR
ncbi:MAG: hypothetical protein U0V49_06680 [Saprospiraceae bacterium]